MQGGQTGLFGQNLFQDEKEGLRELYIDRCLA